MKKTYPSYKERGTSFIEAKLKGKQKKIFNDYMNFLSVSAGERKMVNYRLYFLQFIDIIQKPLWKLTPQDAIGFWALVNQDDTRSVFTKNNIKITVKRFFKWYYKHDVEMRDTLDGLKQKHPLVNEKRINSQTLVTEKELGDMLRSAESLKEKALLITAYESGCRPHELRFAKWKDINWENKSIYLYATKTSKHREVPIHEAIVHLKRWHQEFCFEDVTEQDFLFPSLENRNKPVTEWTFRHWIKSLGKKAGIERTIFPYLLRHTRNSELKRKGVDEQDRKVFAGHSPNSKMQSVYTHMDNKDVIESIISKIYHVEEINPATKEKLQSQIDLLKEALAVVHLGRTNKITKKEEKKRLEKVGIEFYN